MKNHKSPHNLITHPYSRFTILLLLLALSTLPAAALGRQQQSNQPGQSNPPQTQQAGQDRSGIAGTLVLPDQDYEIGPGDVIAVQIEDAAELSGIFRVSAAGSIQMPFLGKVEVKGKTADALSTVLADALRGRYLKNPKVTILIRESNSSAFYMLGAVRKPGVFQVQGRPSMLELLTLAGGLAENHGTTAFVIRKVKPGAQPIPNNPGAGPAPENQDSSGQGHQAAQPADANYELITVNINGLLRGRFEQNMLLEPGDIINIPATDVFFVAGEVKGAGSFPLKEGTTLRQAISIAQGLTYKAAAGHGLIFREDQTSGKREEIHVDIGAIMKGKQDDVRLAANDIIIVPTSGMKAVGGPLLLSLASFGITRVIFQ